MSRPVQKLKLRACAFGPNYTDQFKIHEDGDLIEALDVAADLAAGISQLCSRRDNSINNGEIAFCAEVRPLGFLGDVVATLVRSAERGLKASKEAGCAQ